MSTIFNMSKRNEDDVSIEEIEQVDERGVFEKRERFEKMEEMPEKTSAHHIEYSKGGATKKPYWDTMEVVGANRNLQPVLSFTSRDEVVVRKGFFARRWAHLRKWWKLYTGLVIIGLAI